MCRARLLVLRLELLESGPNNGGACPSGGQDVSYGTEIDGDAGKDDISPTHERRLGSTKPGGTSECRVQRSVSTIRRIEVDEGLKELGGLA